MTHLLEKVNCPSDLKKLTDAQLVRLAKELRELIIHTVSKNTGHLAPSLGTVELTLALHKVFDCPKDKIVWDVGHQAYTHKILTGRRERFSTLRKKGGITGFPKRSESEYDAFGVGHASTSISAALGMALARDLNHGDEHIIAVLGDGALTGGEAFEALNHAGDLGRNLIVVLNDNEMSIDKNVGAMSEYLSKILVAPKYNRAKRDVETLLKSIPHIGGRVLKTASTIKDGVKSMLVPGGLFEELGFQYVGPLDGHNISLLQEVFERVKNIHGPVLVHVHTKKGKGYLPAEKNPEAFHGVGIFDEDTGALVKKEGAPSYTSVFSKTLIELAKDDKDIVAITAAMPSGTGLKKFGEVYPDRYFDVGIAEEHAVTLAAGLAANGKHPVVAIYSTFAQRAYDQLLHDVCLQKLPVTICLDRAGLVGEDGPTHHGVFDFSYLRQMPNMVVMAPKDEEELRQMLSFAIKHNGPIAIRYPRGAGRGVPLTEGYHDIPLGKAEILRPVGEVGILSAGVMAKPAEEAADLLKKDGIQAAVSNMRFIKPLDVNLLREWAESKRLLVTLEENILAGGFGSAVTEFFADEGICVPVLRIGIGDTFVEQGSQKELHELCGFTAQKIALRIKDRLHKI